MMEENINCNMKTILHQISGHLCSESFENYFRSIALSICTHTTKGLELIDFETFANYMNLPLLISEKLFYSNPLLSNSLTIDQFVLCLATLYLEDIDAKFNFLFHFFDFYHTGAIHVNDIRLILYQFHSISEANDCFNDTVAALDQLIENMIKSSHGRRELTYEKYKAYIETNSDLFFLFYFLFETYKPFTEEAINICASNTKQNTTSSSSSSSPLTLSTYAGSMKNDSCCLIKLAHPSKGLFTYINKTFNSKLDYCADTDSDLRELEMFTDDMINIKNQLVNTNYSFGEYTLLKDHLYFRSSKKIFSLRHSFIEFNNDLSIMLHTCNKTLPPIQLTFESKEQTDLFVETYHAYHKTKRVEDDYTIKQEIGSGKFGKIYLGMHKATKEIRTIKEIKKRDHPGYNWELAVSKFLMRFPNINIIRIQDCYETKEMLFICTEFIQNGSLYDFLSESTELLHPKMIDYFLDQIINGIKYLHSHGILHRDIKFDNILIGTNNCAKIIDFGFSRILTANERRNEGYGAPCFISPEIAMKKSYTLKTDLWSLGVLAYFVQFGEMPFDDENDNFNVIGTKIAKIEYTLPDYSLIPNYSHKSYELIGNCFKYEKDRCLPK